MAMVPSMVPYYYMQMRQKITSRVPINKSIRPLDEVMMMKPMMKLPYSGKFSRVAIFADVGF